MLFVHAHPDDETLATGVAIAHHVERGDEVHVLTCTLGDEGEIIPPELVHHGADREDTLAGVRREELRRAMAAIGAQHRVLGEGGTPGEGGSLSDARAADEGSPAGDAEAERDGGPGRAGATAAGTAVYRDSGMAGTPSAAHPRAFVQADLDEAAALVRAVIVELAPDVVVTYDEHGGYRHPDHIQTHRVVRAALRGLPPQSRPPMMAALTPSSWAREDRQWLAERGPADPSWSLPEGDFPPSVVADALVTHAVTDPAAVPRQVAALREHATQVTVVGAQYALSNDIAARLSGREGYAEVDVETGRLVPGAAAGGGRLPLVGGAS
ncbi:N-acetyl-1-D-myo-inositol-2-amino-2-deoxy-alpha-D -glucopyranoside deacetylase [Marihabitans asiaticum]